MRIVVLSVSLTLLVLVLVWLVAKGEFRSKSQDQHADETQTAVTLHEVTDPFDSQGATNAVGEDGLRTGTVMDTGEDPAIVAPNGVIVEKRTPFNVGDATVTPEAIWEPSDSAGSSPRNVGDPMPDPIEPVLESSDEAVRNVGAIIPDPLAEE